MKNYSVINRVIFLCYCFTKFLSMSYFITLFFNIISLLLYFFIVRKVNFLFISEGLLEKIKENKFEVDELKEERKEVARVELRETPEIKSAAIQKLRELLEKDEELHVPTDNDTWLVRFLRPCKFYPSSAYDLIKRYYSFKIKHDTIYDDLLPSKEQNIFKQNILSVLPKRDQHGRRILSIELGKKWDVNSCNLDEVFKGCVLFVEAAMIEPETQVAGGIVFLDMEGLSFKQAYQFTPSTAKRIVDWLQESVPLRVKAIHVIRQPMIFNMVFALFKPFLREKLRNRIIFHGKNMKSLHEHVSPDCLPKSYGGTLDIPEVTGSQWLEVLLQCDDEFQGFFPSKIKKLTITFVERFY